MRAFGTFERWAAVSALTAFLAVGTLGCGEEGPTTSEIVGSGTPIVSGVHDYLFYQRFLDWSSAKAICAYTNSHLATLTTPAENQFVANQINLGPGGEWWMNFTDIVTEGTWKWANNETVSFTNWASGKPNNVNNADCGTVSGATGKWSDANCGVTRMFVCEHDTGLVSNGAMLFFDYSVSNTTYATRNFEQRMIFIAQNDAVTLGTCAVSGAFFTGDTFVRLFNPSGQQVAVSDDSCGLGSNISYVAAVSGMYTIQAGCFDETACTGHLVVRPEPMPPPH